MTDWGFHEDRTLHEAVVMECISSTASRPRFWAMCLVTHRNAGIEGNLRRRRLPRELWRAIDRAVWALDFFCSAGRHVHSPVTPPLVPVCRCQSCLSRIVRTETKAIVTQHREDPQ